MSEEAFYREDLLKHDLLLRRILEAPVRELHLQRFAAEDEGRTEDPTERRQREERDKGNVPKSQDVPQSVVLIGTVLTLFVLGTWMYSQAYSVFYRYLSGEFSYLKFSGIEDAQRIIYLLFWEAGKITAPVVMVAFVMGILGNVAQFGLLFTLRALEFKPERMVPDFKRILPNRKTMINLLKITVQFFVILVVTYFIIIDDFLPMLKAPNMGLKQAIGVFAWVSFKMLLVTGVLLFGLSIPDYFYQRFEYMENLKMNISEVKRERREEEGDPLIRQRQRERAMELRRQGDMMAEVPAADVVVTNPTHYAVAMRYIPGENMAPVVIAKGADHLAFQIRNIAKRNEIHIEESPYLARTLYNTVEVGQEIPEELYRAVVTIFSRLDKFRARGAV